MKRVFTFILALLLILFVQAQESLSLSPANWNSPFVVANLAGKSFNQNAKSIHSLSEGLSSMRGGGNYRYEEGKDYIFDPQGQLTSIIEREGLDTARIITYNYTTNGLRNWEMIEDRSWNKTYKIGYRFNRNGDIYQVKSYEMINDKDAMLLDTRHYIYGKEGQLLSIRYMEYNELSSKRDFTYDRQGRKEGEFVYDRDNQLMESIIYSYDSRGRCTRVVNTNNVESNKHTYRYVYDMYDKLIEASWEEDARLKGRAVYVYNAGGRLLEMQTEMSPAVGGSKVKTMFDYDHNSVSDDLKRIAAAR